MAPDDPRNYEWLDRYLAGDGTEDERALWQRRIDADPELRAVVDGLRDAEGIGAPTEAGRVGSERRWDVDAAWKDAVRRERVRGRGRALRSRFVASGASSWAARGAIAAGIALVVATTVVVASRRGRDNPGPVRDYVSAPGERLNVTLSDGTQFALAPASRLRVPVAYGRDARRVVLEGEAFFRVVHDEKRPFEVHAGNATARDVGTAFDVRSYASDSAVVVAVAEGKVAVGAASLGVGDIAAVSRSGAFARTHEVDLEPYIGWTRGELVFRDTPLVDVARALERWYGVHIVLADPVLARRPVLATYDMQSMTEVLTLLSATVGAHYTQSGKTITIVPGLASGR